MRLAAAMFLLAAACGVKAKKEESPEDHTKQCDALRAAASAIHAAYTQDWVLHAEKRTPEGLCAAIAEEANKMKDTPAQLEKLGDSSLLSGGVHMLADVQRLAHDTAACTKDPAALAEKLDSMAQAFDTGLDGRCPEAIMGAGTPK